LNYHLVAQTIKNLWIILIAYWVIRSVGNKKTKNRQGGAARFYYIALLIASAYAISSNKSLHFFILPINSVTESLGLIVCVAGMALAVWSRNLLGSNWSGFVVIKQDHELIQQGPYQYVRHPLYAGLITAIFGTALALAPTAAGFLLTAVWIVAFYIKSRGEERILLQEFGERYIAYRQRVTGALIPFVL
jgi:protein-S-isoprenylcysteine O-methyltransferase Ste14